jgi:phenylalanyl-tRNA synthetase beta chain
MIISLSWLKKYTDVNLSIDDLSRLIGARLVEIEEVIDLGEKYKDVVIARVVECEPLTNSDHLNLTKIDDGGVTKDVERDARGLVQVVCGAPNVAAGMMVAWLPPKSIVPETFAKPDPFVLGVRSLKGMTSNGMIASPRELDLSDEHEGIMVIDSEVKPGTMLAEHLGLNDYLLDIENKSLTHRPDCFGVVGFAREVAAIQGHAFMTPQWLMNREIVKQNIAGDEKIEVKVTIDDEQLSARYLAVVMSGADSTKKSPMEVQTMLSRIGIRSINAVVDVTNYLMMLTGQPLHAFDYDKLVRVSGGKPEIHVRAGRVNEKLELLDGRVIELTPADIVIAAGETAVGLAGAMGGANTAIDDDTKNIIIESATFSLYNLRATQMRHGIFSEAITRFTKGQSAELSLPVLNEAIRLMNEWAGAVSVSEISQAYPVKHESQAISITTNDVNKVLGSSFSTDQIVTTLKNVEFGVEISGDAIKATAPYWRQDIHIPEDIIEEIGRLNGFDNIHPVLPLRDFTAASQSDFDLFRSRVRKALVRAGANEVLTYSFVHGDILNKVSQKSENSYKIVNSISPDLQYYRQTITPSLLDLVHPNIKQGYDSFALFEVNKTHQKQHGLTDESVPVESDMMALVFADKNKAIGAPYYRAKRMFEYMCSLLGVELAFININNSDVALEAPFEYRRSAKIVDKSTGETIGIIGEYTKSATKNFKLPDNSAGFEVDMRQLFESVKNSHKVYRSLSRYPMTERDICFKVGSNVNYSQIINSAAKALEIVQLESSISPVDIYQSEGSDTKNITIRIRLTSHDHTLAGDEVSSVINSVTSAVTIDTKAVVI